MKFLRTGLFVVLLSLRLVMPVAAHLAGGADVTVGDYLIDVSWDQEQWRVGQLTFLAVNVVNKTTSEPVPFTTAFIRLDAGTATEFSVKAFQDLPGHAAVQFTPTIAGAHQVRLALYTGDALVAETTVPIDVMGESTASATTDRTLWFGLGIVAVVGGMLLWQRLRRGR